MKTGLKIAGGFLIVLVVLQLVSSKDNNRTAYGGNDITQVVSVPDSVKRILEPACFDCHSNHTNYIWYSSVQPVGLWIGRHINEAKEELNFSEFKTYTTKRRARKMHGVVKQLQKGEMPLDSYTWMHPEARLTPDQKQTLIQWAQSSGVILSADSLAQQGR